MLKLTSKGMSVAETMVGLALVSIAIVALLSVTTQNQRSSRYARALTSANNLVTEVKIALDTESGCTSNFGDIVAPLVGNESGDPVSVSAYDNEGKLTRSIAAPDKPYDEYLDVLSVRLKTKAELPDGQVLMALVIQSDKSGEVLGPKATVSEIPLMAKIDAGRRIKSCFGHYSTGGQSKFDEEICRLQSNGVMVFDPVTKKCVNSLVCLDGPDSATAKCPDGKKVEKCTARDYVDAPGPQVERFYENGLSSSAGPPAYIFTITGDDTCNCHYAEGVGVTAATRCQACCIDP